MHFLIALVVMIVATPFVSHLPDGDLIEAALITAVLVLAVPAVGARRRSLVTAAVLAGPAPVARWANHLRPDVAFSELSLVPAIVFAGFVVVHLLLFIVRAPWLNAEVPGAAVATFLMTGVLWALAYVLVARLVPSSFVFTVGAEEHRSMGGLEALYFSFGTLTNYYGDIIPVSRAARTLAIAEAVAGLFFVAVLISRLVSVYSSTPPPQPAGGVGHPGT
jgi:Ion channel